MINFGEWSAKDDKIRVKYENMESSVLFEDTASISYVKVKYADNRYAFGGILLGIVIGFGFVDDTCWLICDIDNMPFNFRIYTRL